MFIERFIEWQQEQPEDAEFKRFAAEHIGARPMVDVLGEIMYQLYMSQCCLEGLIEDMEFTYEEAREQEKKKSKKGNAGVERRKTA